MLVIVALPAVVAAVNSVVPPAWLVMFALRGGRGIGADDGNAERRRAAAVVDDGGAAGRALILEVGAAAAVVGDGRTCRRRVRQEAGRAGAVVGDMGGAGVAVSVPPREPKTVIPPLPMPGLLVMVALPAVLAFKKVNELVTPSGSDDGDVRGAGGAGVVEGDRSGMHGVRHGDGGAAGGARNC